MVGEEGWGPTLLPLAPPTLPSPKGESFCSLGDKKHHGKKPWVTKLPVRAVQNENMYCTCCFGLKSRMSHLSQSWGHLLNVHK